MHLYWLRHYATSRKVAVSIPDEVIGFLFSAVLESSQPLTEMSIRNPPEMVKGGRRVRLATLPLSLSRLWEPRRLTTLWSFTACYMDSLTLPY
jgi:hypothetical protein